jgi:hypothetical protein
LALPTHDAKTRYGALWSVTGAYLILGVAQRLRLSCAASNNPNNFLEGENYGKHKKLEVATGEQ